MTVLRRKIKPQILKLFLFLILLFGIGISLLYVYIGPFTAWDAKTCAQRVGSNLKIDPSFTAIYKYINNYMTENLYIGMARDDALVKLKKLGPMIIDFDRISINELRTYRDIIELKYCYSPINYIGILIFYDSNERISYFDFLRN